MDPVINPGKYKILIAILVGILIFMFGVGSASANLIKFPSINLGAFLPLVMKNYSGTETGTTSDALVVFSSAATTDGDQGRSGMNAICMSEDPEAHFCSLVEIETAWMNGGVRFEHPFNRAWVDYVQLGTVIEHQVSGTRTIEF